MNRRGKLINVGISVLVIVAIIVALTINPQDGSRPAPRPNIELGGPGHKEVPAPPAPVQAQSAAGVADHQGEKDETPEGVPAKEIEQGREQQDKLAQSDQLPIVTPDAAPQQRGCTTRLVRNFSSRRGVRPRILVAHYTVSRNRPGWSDVWAVVGLFDQAPFQASSTDVIDAEGHCAYIVRESDKAWTQATFNPVSLSIEFVAYGDEGQLAPAALAKGGGVFAQEAHRWSIPLQLGKVSGCTVVRPGIVDHSMLGSCGGGHHDIRPFGGDVSDAMRLAPLIRAARAAAVPMHATITTADRVACRKLNWWRRVGRPAGGRPERNAVARRHRLERRHLACTSRGVVPA
jgi:hypothetical protein